MTKTAPYDALSLLRDAVKASQRSSGVQFDRGFARATNPDSQPAPLSRLLKAGDVALRLFLLLTMQATKAPYELNAWVSATYVRILGLATEGDRSARRVRDALRTLEDMRLIAVERRPRGHTPKLTVLRSDGSGLNERDNSSYIGVPIALWSKGWILKLSVPGIVVLIALIDALYKRKGFQHVPTSKKIEYGISDESWVRGTRELEAYGLLEIAQEWVSSDFEKRRQRNTYRLLLNGLNVSAY